MKTFPMFVKTEGRRIVVIGDGESAIQKVRLALKTEARVTIVADELEAEARDLVSRGQIDHHAGFVDRRVFDNCAIAFIAVPCPGAAASYSALAAEAGVLVNVVDHPDLCQAFTPSIVDRAPIVVAIGSEGTAPLLTRMIKTAIEALLEPRLGELAAFTGRLRERVKARVPRHRRRAFWAWVYGGEPRTLFSLGRERDAIRLIKEAVENGAEDSATDTGLVSIVSAGTEGRDVLTIRAVKRLQEADVVFHDKAVGAEFLELARRDCERVAVQTQGRAISWGEAEIHRLMASRATEGKRVVRLMLENGGGEKVTEKDVGIFRRSGVALEIVPSAMMPWRHSAPAANTSGKESEHEPSKITA